MVIELGYIIGATYFGMTQGHPLRGILSVPLARHRFSIATVTDLVVMIVFVVILQSTKTAFRHTRKGLDTLARYAVIATLLNT
ncbi:hypothetical protein OH76DRAFT_1411205 [Lentinus brumalis]|uniref:Uncharacterized protein n=1 Tax=Lentinus brumalis TaxID=2498619 RepID=A0A371CQ53_9APHY|nr:hypothetical protein OH76DRAFT_1411205 [Polyporus brumalis]